MPHTEKNVLALGLPEAFVFYSLPCLLFSMLKIFKSIGK